MASRFLITNNVFPILEQIIKEAAEYVHLVSFLLYDEKTRDLLIEKRKTTNLSIEVYTTPPEAAESSGLKDLSTRLQYDLRAAGVKVVPCDWEVGRPELTISTRAGGRIPRWFALHAKFLVTDKHALVMSADINETFSKGGDWNTCLIHTDQHHITLLEKKYQTLKGFFSDVHVNLGTSYVDDTWPTRKLIKGYPYYEREIPVTDGFYLLPNEGYARRAIGKIIDESEEFIYCAFETLYDDELNRTIMSKLIHMPTVDFRIISAPLTTYVQNPLKTRAVFLQLVSYGAKIRNLENLRGKMIVTDKALLTGSFDLAKMGIGTVRSIGKGIKALVASTDIMGIAREEQLIQSARDQFLNLYEKAIEDYGLWFVNDAERILRLAGAKRIAEDAKRMLGSIIFSGGRKAETRIRKISIISVELARLEAEISPFVRGEHIQKADQIAILDERRELNAKNIEAVIGITDGEAFLKRLRDAQAAA